MKKTILTHARKLSNLIWQARRQLNEGWNAKAEGLLAQAALELLALDEAGKLLDEVGTDESAEVHP